jgi:hypothetical protein
MAENEVLDVKWGRRWKATRLLLRQGEGSAAELASCVCEDAKHDVVTALKRALQKGSPLVAILKAAETSPAELRAAVSIFPDQQLARIARDGCSTSKTKSPEDVANATAILMFDRFADRTLLFAHRNEGWQSEERRLSLRAELERRRDSWVSNIAAILEKSLRGETVKGTRRHRSGERVTAQALVSRSLRPRPQRPSNERSR